MTDDLLALLTEATTAAGELVAAIPVDKWGAPTPCEDMDVAGLVAHLVGGLDQFAAIPSSSAAAGDDGDPAVEDPALEWNEASARYSAACSRLLDAWSTPGTLETVYDMPWGETPGAMLMGFMVIEQVTHGWDLARATGRPATFGDGLAEATLTLAESYDDDTIRVPGMFGPAVDAPAGSPPIDRLAAFLGRRV